jgi:hypothetical protein
MDAVLFSHPVTEEPRPGTLTPPQADRYGGLFRQPVYTPASPGDGTGGPGPRQRARSADPQAHDPSGRRARR